MSTRCHETPPVSPGLAFIGKNSRETLFAVAQQERIEGRTVFGRDPAAYDRARPPYPERVYEVLRDRCGLRDGTAVLELGPGPGTATRRLLELGADPLVAVEPNPASAAYLVEATGGTVEVLVAPFEEVELPRSFDLVVAATSFHWIDPEPGIPKVFSALRDGGWFAMWANIHGDLASDDAFHLATEELLGPSPEVPWARFTDEETNARLLSAAGFEDVEHELLRSSMRFDPVGIRALYATFSGIERRPPDERESVLDGLERIATDEFGGVVERGILTTLYTARKPCGELSASRGARLSRRNEKANCSPGAVGGDRAVAGE